MALALQVLGIIIVIIMSWWKEEYFIIFNPSLLLKLINKVQAAACFSSSVSPSSHSAIKEIDQFWAFPIRFDSL